jgi:hypothetical protein
MPSSPSNTKIGRGNSLFYALIVAAFLTWNTVSWSYSKEEGWTFKSKEVPLAIVTPCLVLMGVALGINLSGVFKALTDLALLVNRNTAQIYNLSTHQTQTQTPETEFKELENDNDPQL